MPFSYQTLLLLTIFITAAVATASSKKLLAPIQLISGHGNRKSLELYQHLSLAAIEGDYQNAVRNLEI